MFLRKARSALITAVPTAIAAVFIVPPWQAVAFGIIFGVLEIAAVFVAGLILKPLRRGFAGLSKQEVRRRYLAYAVLVGALPVLLTFTPVLIYDLVRGTNLLSAAIIGWFVAFIISVPGARKQIRSRPPAV